jgi:5-formyltetrahydrofolate cyclo-ligase
LISHYLNGNISPLEYSVLKFRYTDFSLNFSDVCMTNTKASTAPLRTTLRQYIRTKRQQLSLSEQAQASYHLFTHLSQHDIIKSAKRIAIYLAADGELNALDFIHWCWKNNKEVYLPVIHPFSPGHLLFLKYDDSTVMTHNHYGIEEPKLDVRHIVPVNEIDVVLTPLVAFDAKGNRLGMGGGFYDRTLAYWFEKVKQAKLDHKALEQIKPYPIGIAHDCQEVDDIPAEHWDIPLPEIISPSRHIVIKKF